jgi:hypothetical protein
MWYSVLFSTKTKKFRTSPPPSLWVVVERIVSCTTIIITYVNKMNKSRYIKRILLYPIDIILLKCSFKKYYLKENWRLVTTFNIHIIKHIIYNSVWECHFHFLTDFIGRAVVLCLIYHFFLSHNSLLCNYIMPFSLPTFCALFVHMFLFIKSIKLTIGYVPTCFTFSCW